MLVVEQRYAAIEHDLAVAYTRGERVQTEREPCRERALTQREQLLRGMHDFGEGATDRAPRADAEQIFGGGIQIGDEEAIVENDEGSR